MPSMIFDSKEWKKLFDVLGVKKPSPPWRPKSKDDPEEVEVTASQDPVIVYSIPPSKPVRDIYEEEYCDCCGSYLGTVLVRTLSDKEFAKAMKKYGKAMKKYTPSAHMSSPTVVSARFRWKDGEARGVWDKDTGWHWLTQERHQCSSV